MNHSSAEAERIIRADGWFYVCTKGDHKHFKHPSKPER